MKTFAEKQKAERPKRYPSMEYTFKGAKCVEVQWSGSCCSHDGLPHAMRAGIACLRHDLCIACMQVTLVLARLSSWR